MFKWIIAVLAFPNGFTTYVGMVVVGNCLLIYTYINILINLFMKKSSQLNTLVKNIQIEKKLHLGTILTVAKENEFEKSSINTFECLKYISECETLLDLCDKTNSTLSPFIMIYFVQCLLLIMTYAFLTATILFTSFNFRIAFQVGTLLRMKIKSQI